MGYMVNRGDHVVQVWRYSHRDCLRGGWICSVEFGWVWMDLRVFPTPILCSRVSSQNGGIRCWHAKVAGSILARRLFSVLLFFFRLHSPMSGTGYWGVASRPYDKAIPRPLWTELSPFYIICPWSWSCHSEMPFYCYFRPLHASRLPNIDKHLLYRGAFQKSSAAPLHTSHNSFFLFFTFFCVMLKCISSRVAEWVSKRVLEGGFEGIFQEAFRKISEVSKTVPSGLR